MARPREGWGGQGHDGCRAEQVHGGRSGEGMGRLPSCGPFMRLCVRRLVVGGGLSRLAGHADAARKKTGRAGGQDR